MLRSDMGASFVNFLVPHDLAISAAFSLCDCCASGFLLAFSAIPSLRNGLAFCCLEFS